MTKPKVLKPLEPADPKQCQAEISNGVNFMTLGGRREMVRCKNAPVTIATEITADEHGRRGQMSLCALCWQQCVKQMGKDFATFEPLLPGATT